MLQILFDWCRLFINKENNWKNKFIGIKLIKLEDIQNKFQKKYNFKSLELDFK